MTETAKERFYREELESIKLDLLEARPVSPSNIAKALIEADELPVTTDKLSVEKLEPIGYYNEAHGFLHEEFDKDCYCQGGCSMEAVYTESQVKKLTDEKTVEKLQEHLLPYKKEMVQKIIDEKMQLVTADEFLKLHKESLTAIRENDKLQKEIDAAKKYIEESYKADKEDNKLLDLIIEAVEKLQEQLNTAKKALTEIAYGEYNTFKLSAVPIAKQALAAIGCGGCPVGAVGKNGLTKEEIEGSGDE